LDGRGYLVEEPLRQQLAADLVADAGIGVALLLQLLVVALLAAAEVLRLDLVELGLDVLVGDLDAELARFRLELGVLDEHGHHLGPERRVRGRSCLRELLALRLQAALLLAHEHVELVLGDVLTRHDGDVACVQLGSSTSAAARDEHGEWKREEQVIEPHQDISAQAAWRAASIASSSRRAQPSSSWRSDTSLLAVV